METLLDITERTVAPWYETLVSSTATLPVAAVNGPGLTCFVTNATKYSLVVDWPMRHPSPPDANDPAGTWNEVVFPL